MGYYANVLVIAPSKYYSMKQIILLLIEMLNSVKTKLGKVILILLICLGLVYLCFATSCCSVTSSTHFSVDSAKVSNLDYNKSDSVNFQKMF